MSDRTRDFFGWPATFAADVSLDHFLDMHDLWDFDWDLAVWWNSDFARAAEKLADEKKWDNGYISPGLVTALQGQYGEDYFKQIAARVPRSEVRCADHLEKAVGHALKVNGDVTGRPFVVYDAARGVWRNEGETLSNGYTVGSTVDRVIENFSRAMHRGVDLMERLIDIVQPDPGTAPPGNGNQAVKQAIIAANEKRKRLFKMTAESHEMAKSISRGKQRALLLTLRDRLRVGQTAWDSNTRWLVLRDGVIDLTDVFNSGRKDLLPFTPDTMSTMALDVGLDDATRSAGVSEWDRGVRKVLPDVEVRRYLQKRYGAALLGAPGRVDKSMVWQHGVGDTAKSTIQECIAGADGVFAPYAYQSSSSVLVQRSGANPEAERFKAYARGKRFIIMSEINAGDRMDRGMFTTITGGDTVEGTAKFSNAVSYKFTATLFMASNDAPTYPPGDTTFAQRIHVVPFRHKLWQRTKNPEEWAAADEEHRADPHWQTRVLESGMERAAILHWVLDGLVAFSREGIGDLPEAMLEAREDFSEGADPLTRLRDRLLAEGEEWEGQFEPLLSIYTDTEWGDRRDGDGATYLEVDRVIEYAANAIGMVKFGDTGLSRSYMTGIKKLLDDKGGARKTVKDPDTKKSVKRWSRMLVTDEARSRLASPPAWMG